MNTKKILGLFFLSALSIGAGMLYGQSGQTAIVEAGKLSGVTDAAGITSYKGIPFAAPPVGDLRWRPPMPAAHWDGIRNADHFGNACVQYQAHSRPPYTEPYLEQGPVSEDCLYLNVWTGAKAATERRPVLVWIFGGGFTEGSGSCSLYDGTALAKRGVVLVTLNYRVGGLGFFAHPALSAESDHKTSGNYGLLDQVAALQWVRKNIAAFGGDPNKVTIFGQSAGGISVYDMMQSPLARGLFVRAIAQSGPGLLPTGALGGDDTLATREQVGVKFAESKGAHTLAELRAIPATDFFPAPGSGVAVPRFGPFADGWVLPRPGDEPKNEVPVIVGMVANDIGIASSAPAQKPTVATYQAAAQKKYGSMAEQFLKLYPVSSDNDVIPMQIAATQDQARVSYDLWSAKQAGISSKVYDYYFDRAMPWPEHPEFQAFHAVELPYVFETLDQFPRPWEATDHKVADEISQYWLNFAITGDPSGKGLAKWPEYRPDAHVTMEIGAKVGPMPVAMPERLAFQEQFLKQPPPAGR